jgi:hypothetical protein
MERIHRLWNCAFVGVTRALNEAEYVQEQGDKLNVWNSAAGSSRRLKKTAQ